ncbi:PHP domain-containing protein [Pannus brasiliensis CCIBt3594]|uniref:PHP domain-containing protein n=1 Tax=Pannus brasiliensis CCIBt3594 TaxID=1427578 RepID=A0AAW9QVY2_9CHRO
MAVISAIRPFSRDISRLKAVWSTITADSCPRDYNFHLHTRCSDGQLTPEEVIQQAVRIGLQGLAITDHHSIEGYRRARQWLDRYPEGSSPHLWTGIEITSQLLDTRVHILGYGFDPEHPVLEPYLQGTRPEGENALAGTVIECLHRAGGLVILAHPFRYRLPAKDAIAATVNEGIDGIEAFYAYDNPKPWRTSQPESDRALEFARKYELFTTCGTDSHGVSILLRV